MIIKKQFKNLLLIIFIFFSTVNFSKSYEEIKILYKIDDKIITNLDVINEYNYLIALNNDLANLEKKESLKIAKDSLIREKIKFNELVKYVDIEKFDDKNLIGKIIENFYLKLNLSDTRSFETYLNKFGISLIEVENKIKIEILWNQLIFNKFKNQININIPNLKNKIKKDQLNKKILIEYDLSEIVFKLTIKLNCNQK